MKKLPLHFSALVLMTLALLLNACSEPSGQSGPLTAQQRDVSDFNSVDMKGAGQIFIEVGSKASLRLEASQRVLDHLTSEVHNGTLELRSTSHWMWMRNDDRLRAHITLPRLQGLQLAGAGDVSLTGLDGGDTTIVISGAGHIEAKGRLDKLTATLNGAASGDFTRVDSGTAVVAVNGAGSLQVHAIESLDATINGVGTVEYEGDPKDVRTALHGVGTISHREARASEHQANKESASGNTSL
jgi:hypothetical protein